MAKDVQIYTKTGDNGTTGLIGGARVKKYDIRLEAYGTIDELNSQIGLIVASGVNERAREVLTEVQSELFTIGAHLATDDSHGSLKDKIPVRTQDIEKLEHEMDNMFEVLPRLNHFIMPGGSAGAAHAHVARTVCRRAERRIVELAEKTDVDNNLIKYVNRLSDYLFVLARQINHDDNIGETQWRAKTENSKNG